MTIQLVADDRISRCIIFDRAFEDNAHVDELLWRFEGSDANGIYHESAVLRRLAPASTDVHRIGCAIAAGQNVRKQEPPPGRKRRYYCGYRSATFGDLPVTGEGYTVTMSHSPEGGEESHLDVSLSIHVEGRSARAVRRTNAGLALAEHFGPPRPHRCNCDTADDQHPFDLLGADCLISGLAGKWPSLNLSEVSGPLALVTYLANTPDAETPAHDA